MNKYIKAILIWTLIIPLAILNGGLREYVLISLGSIALPLSGIILSILIFIMAFFFIPRIKNCKKKDYIIFGIVWFILTNLFDLSFFIIEGGGLHDLIKSYDIRSGNTWLLVVLSSLFSPIFAMKLTKKNQ